MDVPEDPSRADPTTIQDKFLVEYRARYTCPGDGEPISPGHQGWSGWYSEHIPDVERPKFDIWPDMSSYSPSELYPVPGLTNSLNEQMHLFSSRNPVTVQRHARPDSVPLYLENLHHRHFRWMREHEIDGALLHRWASNLAVGRENIVKRHNDILDKVRAAAEKEGRVFAIRYSFANTPTLTLLEDLTRDWKHLIHDKDLLASSSYLRENGKPVISLIYLGDGRTLHAPGLIRSIVAMFRGATPGGAYILGILPFDWKSGLTDPSKNPELIDVWLSEFDAIGPNVSQNNRERMQGDKDFITAWLADRGVGRNIDYIPTVCPGQSSYNSDGAKSESFNRPQRDGGRYLWEQLYSASRLSVQTIIGVSWDNFYFGHALMPVIPTRNLLPQSTKFRSLALDADGYDLPSDWYMRIITDLITLLLLSRLAQVFNVFPASYELKGIVCDLTKPLDEGGFGYVYKAVHKGQSVCVKAIRVYERQSSNRQLRALSKELVLWAHLFHVNVVPFYGVWIIGSSPSRIGIVSPWMENGNLCQYLENNTEGTPRLLLVSDVASGLEFLHRSGIVHADLKGANVLVSSTGRAMLTDFGASHIVRSNPTTTTQAAITPHWAAPELLREVVPRPSQASDVWAFGCVIYEVVSGKIPFYLWPSMQVILTWVRLVSGDDVTPLTADPDREALQIDEPLKKLMNLCWNYNEQERPRSEEIVRLFSDLNLSDNRPLPKVDNYALTATHRAGSHIHIDYNQVYHILNLFHEAPAQGLSDETKNEA
ncbi:hypothetical protein NP233_g11419 [Leucocoprinus birnbaumii]|uniref:Protein kinase domain-containing protein n=1 Tax=Leucocoprinus birnbaumii TaxID=56174 RepID=A0AAD5VIZ6_9AGAR|nr:hypothetical protein NP233_g11419 [Leucocoprinus birnbaumii]